ncbi:unnamed protein product [Rhizophagus irregularis]|nr:unnamed protein product [Rhizophagus irregularis]
MDSFVEDEVNDSQPISEESSNHESTKLKSPSQALLASTKLNPPSQLPLAANESTEANKSTKLNPPSQSPLAADESTKSNESTRLNLPPSTKVPTKKLPAKSQVKSPTLKSVEKVPNVEVAVVVESPTSEPLISKVADESRVVRTSISKVLTKKCKFKCVEVSVSSEKDTESDHDDDDDDEAIVNEELNSIQMFLFKSGQNCPKRHYATDKLKWTKLSKKPLCYNKIAFKISSTNRVKSRQNCPKSHYAIIRSHLGLVVQNEISSTNRVKSGQNCPKSHYAIIRSRLGLVVQNA